MKNYKQLKRTLNQCISSITDVRSIFCVNPESDFTRNRKLPFDKVLKHILFMEAGSLKDELLKLNDFSLQTPSASAFVQARNKIKPDAFRSLLNLFNQKTHKDHLFHGYRLMAVDGSELPIDNTVYDRETTVLTRTKTRPPYSAFHITVGYDLMEQTYEDPIIQGEAMKDENDAFCQIVDRYQGSRAIFIADRGFESYNCFEHVVRSGNKYLIRVRDIHSVSGMLRSLGPFPDDEFDMEVSRTLTIRNTKEVKASPHLYKFCPNNQRFDFMSKEDPWYDFSCRIVRFRLSDDHYEAIVTNLDKDEFSKEEIRELYHMRWGEETSFRELKYAIGLNALHAKKRDLIRQEIYARILLYNFCQRVVKNIHVQKKEGQKYTYQVNFTRSIHIIREFLRKKGGKNPPVESLIAKEILPVRPDRKYQRHLKPKSVVCFNYRFD